MQHHEDIQETCKRETDSSLEGTVAGFLIGHNE